MRAPPPQVGDQKTRLALSNPAEGASCLPAERLSEDVHEWKVLSTETGPDQSVMSERKGRVPSGRAPFLPGRAEASSQADGLPLSPGNSGRLASGAGRLTL